MAAWRRLWKLRGAGASTCGGTAFDRGIAVVVFTVPLRRLVEMDVATGPCVPVRGASKPVCSPLSQDRSETPQQTAALFSVLTGRPADGALIEVGRSGAGVLYRCADEFVDAMADANELLIRLGDQDEAAGDGEFSRFEAELSAYDRAWLAAGGWFPEMVSTRNRLTRLSWAMAARGSSQPLYCWFGPAVAQFVVRGSGQQQSEAL
jgi:hypothetical protein